jgi:hypothetical protein
MLKQKYLRHSEAKEMAWYPDLRSKAILYIYGSYIKLISRRVSYFTPGTLIYLFIYLPSQIGRNLSVSSCINNGQITSHSWRETYRIAPSEIHFWRTTAQALCPSLVIGYEGSSRATGFSVKIGLNPWVIHFNKVLFAPVLSQCAAFCLILPAILSSMAKGYVPQVPASCLRLKVRLVISNSSRSRATPYN